VSRDFIKANDKAGAEMTLLSYAFFRFVILPGQYILCILFCHADQYFSYIQNHACFSILKKQKIKHKHRRYIAFLLTGHMKYVTPSVATDMNSMTRAPQLCSSGPQIRAPR